MTDAPRWNAVATYRTENGDVDVEWQFEELDELHDLVERGPSWETIVDIRITLQRVLTAGLTVEEARKQ